MRIIVAAACASLGVVLYGCGGAGDGNSTTTQPLNEGCLAEKMAVVSQTISGTTEVSVDATFNGTTVTTTMTADFREMLDFEQFNMREDSSATVKIDVQGQTLTVSTNTTQIVNIGEKQAISYSSVDMNGTLQKTCMIEKLPDETPSAVELSMLMKTMVMPLLEKTAICAGNDGMYDTWTVAKTYSGPLPQIPDSPIPPQFQGLEIKDGSFSEEVQMTKDSLVHASSTTVSGELLNKTETLGNVQLQASMTITDVKAGGPSADDLDPSQFDVNCTEAPSPMDLEAFLRSPGFARQQLARILETAKKSTEDSLLV
jgi:hypothetical protein